MSVTATLNSADRPLRVLFSSRTTLFSGPGGDTIQILKTAEVLRELGCHIEISTDADPTLNGFDLLHIFNITRPQALLLARRARRLRIPVALSPIYVDYREVDRIARGPLQRLLFRFLPGSTAEYLKVAGRAVLNGEINRGTLVVLRKGYRRAQRDLIELSSVLLPNSESEMQRIKTDFPEACDRHYAVVPNAVDHRLFDPERTAPLTNFQDCVLSVGRIERRKCQLELVRALRGTGLHLVFLGKPGPNHIGYFEQIKREADDNVTFIGHVDQKDLPGYYAACKVHALVSWMETTGLSSLEAGVMRANLVITDKGDTRDYFGDFAHYCSPHSIDSIRQAVLEAHRAPRSQVLRERILQHFTWNEAARCTLAAYRSILG
jgi:glycosyltransferase involved in cell wall biosynthesis